MKANEIIKQIIHLIEDNEKIPHRLSNKIFLANKVEKKLCVGVEHWDVLDIMEDVVSLLNGHKSETVINLLHSLSQAMKDEIYATTQTMYMATEAYSTSKNTFTVSIDDERRASDTFIDQAVKISNGWNIYATSPKRAMELLSKAIRGTVHEQDETSLIYANEFKNAYQFTDEGKHFIGVWPTEVDTDSVLDFGSCIYVFCDDYMTACKNALAYYNN